MVRDEAAEALGRIVDDGAGASHRALRALWS